MKYEVITNKRIESGLSKRKLAQMIDVPVESIRYWENKRVNPSADSLLKLMKIFDLKVEDLLDGQDLIYLSKLTF